MCKLEWIIEAKWALGCLRRNWKCLENYDNIYNFIIKKDLQAYHFGWLELLWVLKFTSIYHFIISVAIVLCFSRLLIILCTMCWGHLVSLIRVKVEWSLFSYRMYMSHWHICLRCTAFFDHNKNHYLLILGCYVFCLSLVILLCFNKFRLYIMTVSSFIYLALVLTTKFCEV